VPQADLAGGIAGAGGLLRLIILGRGRPSGLAATQIDRSRQWFVNPRIGGESPCRFVLLEQRVNALPRPRAVLSAHVQPMSSPCPAHVRPTDAIGTPAEFAQKRRVLSPAAAEYVQNALF
jgi:hypothetical protein